MSNYTIYCTYLQPPVQSVDKSTRQSQVPAKPTTAELRARGKPAAGQHQAGGQNTTVFSRHARKYPCSIFLARKRSMNISPDISLT